jgi:trimeric autotransporter adhesin
MKRAKWFSPLLLVALSTCGRESLEPEPGNVEAIVVTPAISTVSVGSSIDLTAEVLDASGVSVPDRSVHWASEDPQIATVSGDGTVTAVGVGTVQVAASTGGRSGIAQVTVTTTPVASIQVTPGNKSLFVEESFQFTAVTRDGGGTILTGRPIAWTSNNESVAAVSSTGLVTALAPGGAIITATSEGRSTPASVTVAAIPVATIQLQPRTLALINGQTAQLQAQPVDANGKPLIGRVILWFTNNASVATVSANGLVTAQTPGTATITATSEGKSNTSTVTVTAPAPNVVVLAPAQAVVQEGSTTQLTAQVLDNLGRVLPNANVEYSSSNAAVATVNASGLVTGVTPGKATITGTSGGKTGTAEVTVTPTPVASVSVSPSNPTITLGRAVTLTAQAIASNGQVLAGRTVSWSSGAPNIATVTSGGVVGGVGVGSAVIFASIDGVLGHTTVTVVPVPVASVTVSPATASVNVGSTTQLTVTLKDASGLTLTGRVVGWSSSQATVATVSPTGLVTGVSAGTATITATSEGRTGTATVTVTGARTVTITPPSATINVLGTVSLTATVRDPSGVIVPNAQVTWSTSNALVAGVSSSGLVSGLLPGTATITAKSGSAQGTAVITVK